MRRYLFVAVLLASPCVAHAQQPPAAKQGLPAGWMGRADENGDIGKVSFTAMSRGWHVVTGSIHGIFYKPETTGTGNYTATLDAFYFGPPGQYPEGYGIFVGGKDLAGPNQSYLYFLAANDGRYLVTRRTGATTTTLIKWTPSSAIKTVAAGSNANVENVFKIQARKDSVLFSINDIVVAARPRSELAVDGIVGFRINHSLSIHVAGLTVAQAK